MIFLGKKILKSIVTSAAVVLPMFLFAQNEDDALRYTYYNPIGTARFSALGGSMGALGGDFGALSTNPASIGFYRRSELSITPNFYFDNTGADFNGSSVADNKLNFNFSNVGAVFTSINEELENKLKGKRLSTRERKRVKGWMTSSFAIGFNRLASFHQNYVIQGTNPQSSIANAFAANSQGLTPEQLNPFAEGLAYNVFLTDTVGSLVNYQSFVPYGGTLQRMAVNSKGSISEFVFSYGANYNHKWYFGGTISIPRIRYTSQSVYTESNEVDTISMVDGFVFDSLRYDVNQVIKGSGINLKLGAIYKVSDMLRFGLAFHTPSFLRITQNYDAFMRARFKFGQNTSVFQLGSPAGQITFNQSTPLRAIASMAILFEKKGFLSLEYELIPYGMSRLSSNIYDFTVENQAIKDKYATTGNIRVGGEIRMSDRVAARAGFAYLGDPFKKELGNSRVGYNGSLGLGYRKDGFFADFTYVLGYRKQDYYIYRSDLTAPAEVTTTTHNLLISLGVRF
jgi:hypothetical protein